MGLTLFLPNITKVSAIEEDISQYINGGILEISYKTSYHGSWYYTSCLDVWRINPTTKTPGSAYGEDVYRSK